MKQIAVYTRVSTSAQETASQRLVIEGWLQKHRPGMPVVEYVDQGFSGKNTNRPAYQRMCEAIAMGEVATVVVYRLDRVGRNAIANVHEVSGWIERGVEFFAVDQPYLHLGKDNPLRMSLLGIFSDQTQMERESIVSRVKSGLAARRASGHKLGPQFTIDAEEVIRLRNQGLSFREIARRLGIAVSSANRLYNTARE